MGVPHLSSRRAISTSSARLGTSTAIDSATAWATGEMECSGLDRVDNLFSAAVRVPAVQPKR